MDGVESLFGREVLEWLGQLAMAYQSQDAGLVKRLFLSRHEGALAELLLRGGNEEGEEEAFSDAEFEMLAILARISQTLDIDGHMWLLDCLHRAQMHLWESFDPHRHRIQFFAAVNLRRYPPSHVEQLFLLLLHHPAAGPDFFCNALYALLYDIGESQWTMSELETLLEMIRPLFNVSAPPIQLALRDASLACRNGLWIKLVLQKGLYVGRLSPKPCLGDCGSPEALSVVTSLDQVSLVELKDFVAPICHVSCKPVALAMLSYPGVLKSMQDALVSRPILRFLLKRAPSSTVAQLKRMQPASVLLEQACRYPETIMSTVRILREYYPDFDLAKAVAPLGNGRWKCAMFTYGYCKDMPYAALRILPRTPEYLHWRPWTHRFFSSFIRQRVATAMLCIYRLNRLVRPVRERILIRAFKDVRVNQFDVDHELDDYNVKQGLLDEDNFAIVERNLW